jgi:hypothetical protein
MLARTHFGRVVKHCVFFSVNQNRDVNKFRLSDGLVAFPLLLKVTISFIMPVHLSVRMEQLDVFAWYFIFDYFRNYV